MRHLNREMNSYFRHTHNPYKPYQTPYTFTRASMKCRYVKFLDYIAKHPGCKRFDIICDVYGYNKDRLTPAMVRGQASLIFANLLYQDVIDYDKQYRYTLTDRGQQILDYAKFRQGE